MRELIDRQAAIDALMEAVKSVGVLDADDIKTVFDMLPSVQQEKAQLTAKGTTSDLISRQQAIDAIENSSKPYVWQGAEIVRNLPPARPELQWIPISDRLPRDGSWNIFTDGKNISVERYKEDAIDHFFPNGRWFQLEDVIAWMPLPEAYRPNK